MAKIEAETTKGKIMAPVNPKGSEEKSFFGANGFPLPEYAVLRGRPLVQVLASLFEFKFDAAALPEGVSANNEAAFKEFLVQSKKVTPQDMAKALAVQLGLPFLASINVEEIPDPLLKDLPIAFAKLHRVLPFGYEADGRVRLAVADALDLDTQDELRFLFQRDLTVFLTAPEVVLAAINRCYDRAMRQAETAVAELEEEASLGLKGALEEEVVDLLDVEGDDEAPIIRLVNSLMSQAVKDRASDIHVEPFERELVVRFRIDGILYEIIKPPKRFQNSIISRIKIMAGLNIAEKRLPQDGRIRLKVAGKDFDIRVSTVPTGYGERIVMRLLDRSSVMRDLGDIGFSEANLKIMNQLIQSSHGIILVSGPTGSGKTSTLYGCLAKINKPTLNILTIEDPVEYQLAGVGQVQVNPKIDLTFASGLRSFLRQDPDVIMVGEIRDRETAEIAIQASLTGHLVFSTVHTNDAPGAITRLVDMHVEPFLVASSLIAVLAQRLVRTICPHCKESYPATAEELAEIGLSLKDVKVLWRGVGCKECQNTGYQGRLGIFELMVLNEDLHKLILQNADAGTIKAKAREHGMRTLREDGADKVIAGITTIAEVTRVTREDTAVLEEVV
jgi:general secretion pathway protein E